MAKQYGMVIDTTRCMGCQTCVISCKISNNSPQDIYWNRVVSNDGDEVYRPTGTYPNARLSFRPELCNHCKSPACVAQCPVGALQKREDNGIVIIDQEICIGCGTCVKSCPYSIPKLDEEKRVSSKCDLCLGRIENGKLPWCVEACPGEARIVGDFNDSSSDPMNHIKSRDAKLLHEEYGTEPSTYYI